MCFSGRSSAVVILALLLATLVVGQTADLNCLKKPYDWGGLPNFPSATHVPGIIEGADLLCDSLRIAYRRAKPEFITVFVERHQVIRFDQRDAITEYATFTLPESFDPTFDQQDLPIDRRGRDPRPLFINATVDRFAARVIGPPDHVRNLDAVGKVVRQRQKAAGRFQIAWSYVIQLPGVMPGDTVEVHYKYKLPFEENWQRLNAMRLFFEGALHKHRYHLMLEADPRQGMVHWGIAPDSVYEAEGMRRAVWTRRDLPAIADEVNARPYRDRPHLVVGTQQNAGLYMHVTASGAPVDIPYWVKVMRIRERDAHWWRRVARKKIPDAQTNRMKHFMSMYNDPSPVQQAARIHSAISSDFTFQWDDAWYDDLDRGLQKLGDQMRDHRLREISRYDFYAKYLSMLRLKYHTAYMLDKRVGAITMDWLSPVWNNEWLFVLNDGGRPMSLHPKRRRFGLLPNELPFYWEGTQALVGDMDDLWDDGALASKDPPIPELLPLPVLDPALNHRNTSATLTVDLSNLVARMDARVLLSGQYSTLCRGAWLYHEVDSTIDPQYGAILVDAAGVEGELVAFGQVQAEAPFQFPIQLEADLQARISIGVDSTWTIDLTGLLTHVVPHDLQLTGRDLPFWFDFAGSDVYSYQLRFDQPVELLQAPEAASHEVLTPYADHRLEVRSIDPSTIEVVSSLRIKREQVPMEDLGSLAPLLEQAGRNELRLRVRAAEQAP